MLPNFFVVGAQKAGTTALHEYLVGHPQIYLPRQKETKFFVDDERYTKGIGHYKETHFSSCNGQQAIGEIDPDYMYFEQGIKRIGCHVDLSATKFIFILRNPIDRAFSHYLMTYRRGLESLPFEEAILYEPERIKQGYLANMHYSYVSRGFYHRQILQFLEYINLPQALFLLSEELKQNPLECLHKVLEFLGVSSNYLPPNLNHEFHVATVPRSMAMLQRIKQKDTIEKKLIRLLIPWRGLRIGLRQKILDLNQTKKYQLHMRQETRNRLIDIYREENKKLADLLGISLAHWT